MQCPNCQFENMPGTAGCARCGTSLRLAALAISVHPPRAKVWQKRTRRMLPGYGFTYRLRRGLGNVVKRLDAIAHPQGTVLESTSLFMLVVPGWPQFHAGYHWRSLL